MAKSRNTREESKMCGSLGWPIHFRSFPPLYVKPENKRMF